MGVAVTCTRTAHVHVHEQVKDSLLVAPVKSRNPSSPVERQNAPAARTARDLAAKCLPSPSSCSESAVWLRAACTTNPAATPPRASRKKSTASIERRTTRQRHWATGPSAHNAPPWLQPCPTGLLHWQISLCPHASLASVTPPDDLTSIGPTALPTTGPPTYRSPSPMVSHPSASPSSKTAPSTSLVSVALPDGAASVGDWAFDSPGQCLSAAQSATQQC